MAKFVLTDATLWYEGYDLTGVNNQLEASVEADQLDATTFASAGWRESKAGLKSVALSAGGFLSHGTGEVDPVLLDNLGGATVITITPTGADGETGYLLQSRQSSVTLGQPIGELATWQMAASGRSGAGLVRGTILLPKAARTATGTGTGRQLGAVDSSEKLYASLHVLAVSGTSPTLDAKIVSDDNTDFSSATDRVTFSQATAIGAQWGSVSGAVADDYWRVAYTIGGTNPSFTFAVVAGIA